MFAANAAFIAAFTTSPRALLPLACFLALGYVAVWSAQFNRGRFSSSFFVLGTLLIFCWLKKYWFLSFIHFLPFVYLTVGLSYAFFRIMGMIIDARSDASIAKVDPIAYFNFAMNFPTVIAGPIDRYQEFAQPPLPLTLDDVASGIERIAMGFFKVLVLSTLLSKYQATATKSLIAAGTFTHGVWPAVISFGLYPVFLYFNFSGYTDIVIGIGRLFGKQYPENFNAPFSSLNFIDFWSRWHMSLSFWLRDYVYTPLLTKMMEVELPRALDPYLGVTAYFITFFLIGIWHGSTAIFAIYGLLLALGVSICKFYQIFMAKTLGKKRYKELSANLFYRFASRALTYTWYSFCMICFWNTGQAALQLITHLGAIGMVATFAALLFASMIILNLFEEVLAAFQARVSFALFGDFAPYARTAIFAALIFGCLANVILTQTVDANIIYQAF